MKRKLKTPPVESTDEADNLEDTPEYLATWARSLVKAGKADARLVLADYKSLAANRELHKSDRDIARKRAEALERIL